jgi:cell division protein FtsW
MREIDHTLLACTMILVGFGLVMVLSASYYSAMHSGNIYSYFRTQAFGAALGLIGMIVAATANYKLVSKFAGIFYLVSCGLLVWVALFGRVVNGARRWIDIGPEANPIITFQPSELAKVAVVLMLAVYINADKNRVNNLKGLIGYGILTAIPVALVLWGRNLSTAIIIAAIAFVMLFLASPYFWRFIIAGAAGIAAVVGVLLADLHFGIFGGIRGQRFATWQDPFLDPQVTGFQTIQSLFAVASGGLFGRGLGNSMQKLYYLPESQNDFIFAIIIEELGLFGGGIILLLFAIIVWRGMRAALNARDNLSMMIATGITTMIAVQVIVNVGVVTNTIPNTGIPLPFISYGGTSIAVMMAAVGLLLNITRYPKRA